MGAVLTPEESDQLSKILRAQDLLPVYFSGSGTSAALASVNIGSWTPKQDYFLVACSMSGICQVIGGQPARSTTILTWQNAHNHLIGGGNAGRPIVGDGLAIMEFLLERQADFNFGKRGIFVEKGRTIYAHLHTTTGNGIVSGIITMYLQGIYA